VRCECRRVLDVGASINVAPRRSSALSSIADDIAVRDACLGWIRRPEHARRRTTRTTSAFACMQARTGIGLTARLSQVDHQRARWGANFMTAGKPRLGRGTTIIIVTSAASAQAASHVAHRVDAGACADVVGCGIPELDLQVRCAALHLDGDRAGR